MSRRAFTDQSTRDTVAMTVGGPSDGTGSWNGASAVSPGASRTGASTWTGTAGRSWLPVWRSVCV